MPLEGNQISDVSALASLSNLEYMPLKGNPIRGIKSWITIARIKCRGALPAVMLVLVAVLVLCVIGLVLLTGLVLLRRVTRRVWARPRRRRHE